MLTTGTHALAKASFESLRQYLAQLFAPSIVVVPALVLLSGYLIWKALRRNGPWRLLALALLSQVPVCLLLVVEGWAPRQYLVPQTLFFCTLGALVVDALKVAVGAAASPESSYPARLAGAVVIASLGVLLVIPSVERVRALLPENPGGASEHHRVAPQATEMIHWIAENVPGGKRVLATPAYSLNKYLAFLDGGRHEWTFMRLDQEPCKPRPNIQIGCNPHENDISRIQPDAVWVLVNPDCRAISLSMSNLLEQVRRTGSDYVMISGYNEYPGILGLPARLQESGAFEVVHTEPGHGGGSGASRGFVLLKITGRAPEAVPTQMDASTVLNLKRCEQALGQGYQNWLSSKFPNGILEVPAY